MKLNNIFKFSYLILLIILAIVLRNQYTDFNFFERFFGNPFLLIFDLLINVDIALAFILSLFVCALIFVPQITLNFISTKNFLGIFPTILKIHNEQGKDSSEKLNSMIEIMEKENASLFSPFWYLFYTIIYGFSMSGVFNMLSEYESVKCLWFDIQSYDKLFILPILALGLMSFSIYKSFKNKNFSLSKGKIKFGINIFFLILKISLIIRSFYSVKMCLCIIFIVIIMSTINMFKKVKRGEKNEKRIATKTEDSKQ